MSKRFIDTEIWNKSWFRKLEPNYKCLWIFLFTRCNYAGIWEVDEDQWEFFIGKHFKNINRTKEIMAKQIIEIDDGKRWFMPDFIKFQYGKLRPTHPIHRKVISMLNEHNLNGYYEHLVEQ